MLPSIVRVFVDFLISLKLTLIDVAGDHIAIMAPRPTSAVNMDRLLRDDKKDTVSRLQGKHFVSTLLELKLTSSNRR